MHINGRWQCDDKVSGLRLTVIEGERFNRLHIDIIGEPLVNNRDFYFRHDGNFDGTGSGLCTPRDVDAPGAPLAETDPERAFDEVFGSVPETVIGAITPYLTEGLVQELAASKEYRSEFVVAHAKHALPLQINDLLDEQDLTQTKLADLAEIPQGTVSRAANPKYGNLTINTLVRLAAGFDVAFVAKFVPFSEFIKEIGDKRPSRIPKFTEEFDERGAEARNRQPKVSDAS